MGPLDRFETSLEQGAPVPISTLDPEFGVARIKASPFQTVVQAKVGHRAE